LIDSLLALLTAEVIDRHRREGRLRYEHAWPSCALVLLFFDAVDRLGSIVDRLRDRSRVGTSPLVSATNDEGIAGLQASVHIRPLWSGRRLHLGFLILLLESLEAVDPGLTKVLSLALSISEMSSATDVSLLCVLAKLEDLVTDLLVLFPLIEADSHP